MVILTRKEYRKLVSIWKKTSRENETLLTVRNFETMLQIFKYKFNILTFSLPSKGTCMVAFYNEVWELGYLFKELERFFLCNRGYYVESEKLKYRPW